MNVFLQIIAVNPIREGIGKLSNQPYRMQDCECLILRDDATPVEVGVLMLNKEQVGSVTPGVYAGTFALRADKSEKGQRRIGAVLTSLVPVKRSGPGFVEASATAAAPSPAVKA